MVMLVHDGKGEREKEGIEMRSDGSCRFLFVDLSSRKSWQMQATLTTGSMGHTLVKSPGVRSAWLSVLSSSPSPLPRKG